MKYIPIAILLFTSGCASRFIDRRADETLQQNRQWQRNEQVDAHQNTKVDERKVNRRVKRTPALKPDGNVATLPNGQPAFIEEVEDGTSDTSTTTELDVLRQLKEQEAEALELSRKLREREERRTHMFKLLGIAAVMVAGLAFFIYLAIKRKWVFGWFW